MFPKVDRGGNYGIGTLLQFSGSVTRFPLTVMMGFVAINILHTTLLVLLFCQVLVGFSVKSEKKNRAEQDYWHTLVELYDLSQICATVTKECKVEH